MKIDKRKSLKFLWEIFPYFLFILQTHEAILLFIFLISKKKNKLKVLKCDISNVSDFYDFYTISLYWGDSVVKKKKTFF